MWLIVFMPLIYIAFALQLTLAPQLAIAGCTPQFVLVVLMLIVPRMNGFAGLLSAATCGLIADCLATTGLSVNVVCFTWIAFFAQRAAPYLSPRTPALASLIVAIPVVVAVAVSAAARLWLARQQIAHSELAILSIGNGVYTGLLATIVLLPLRILSVSNAPSSSSNNTGRVANRWKMLTN